MPLFHREAAIAPLLLLRHRCRERAAVYGEVGLGEGGFVVFGIEELAVHGDDFPLAVNVEQER